MTTGASHAEGRSEFPARINPDPTYELMLVMNMNVSLSHSSKSDDMHKIPHTLITQVK
jgi:hypothetical protein